jgi:glycosyltransferase involved in cell wall biosynthesis
MSRAPKIVVLGMMAKMPVPGVVWQTVHYLLGLRSLGFEPYYVEAHGRTPSMLMRRDTDDAGAQAAAFIAQVMRRFDFGDAWAYHALHDADAPCHGLSESALRALYRDAALIVNLHGGTEPRPEHYETGRLVYLQTDPVQLQVELHDGVQASVDFLEPHCAFFTFAENLGGADCDLPSSERFRFRPTRQPVVCDLWTDVGAPELGLFTTVGNWRQPWRRVELDGTTYGWSKDREWAGFLDLPRRTEQPFELALSSYRAEDKERLEARGWRVRHAMDFDVHGDDYRRYVAGSRAEFTVAKEQNVRFRTGWFSDRSATYLAAGRPVITQDTGFGAVLPTGEGLFAVTQLDEAIAAVEAVNGDYARHRRAAAEIAREHFDAKRVLGDLLNELGVGMTTGTTGREMTGSGRAVPEANARRRPLTKDARVLALIPHFRCEEWLDDALESLTQQTRPLDGIVVIDDASDDPPLRLVQRHPGVTLLHADRNVGPYRLVQQVIEETDYDAYLFQDADDWSAPDRLERLLAAAERTGAELIGTHEIRVFCDEPEVAPIDWPLDVDKQFAERPTAFPLLHPTSIVSRELVMALGGFSSGLRFSGDAEFLRRARFVAKVVNIPAYTYFRRIRQGSLTTAPETGLKSPERQQVMEMLWDRARRNAELAALGEAPDLTPCRTAPPVGLSRLAGPPLRAAGAEPVAPAPAPRAPSLTPSRTGGPPRPIFVIGADRSGVSALAWALGQHPRIPVTMDTGWMAELARELPAIHERKRPADVGVERFSRTFGRAAAALLGTQLDRWIDASPEHTHSVAQLAKLFPEARFVHVVRDVDAVVRSLVDPPLGSAAATGGTQIPPHLRLRVSEREAVERWMAAVCAGVEAEHELGGERVLRVSFDELVARPEALVRRCLAFVGEEYDGRCLRPLRGLGTGTYAAQPAAGGTGTTAAHAALRAAARALSDELLQRDERAAVPLAPAPVTPTQPAPPPSPPTPSRAFAAPAAAAVKGDAPRIVMVTDHFPKFSETFFASELMGLLERGWDVHVLCNRSNQDQWPYFPELRELLERKERIHVIRDFEAQLTALQPDVVHFGYGTLALGRMHVRELLGCKVVVSFRGYDVNYFGLEDPHCYDDVWANADLLNLVSEDIWKRAQRRGCPSDKPHVVITDAADVSRFTAPQRRYLKAGTTARPLRLLSVGRLHWKKGYEYALAAVRALIDAGIEVEYRILGDGPHRESILFAIHDLELERYVELPGARRADDVRNAMAWADVCVHAAVSEGFCVSVIEAQAMGLPVVCTDADGLRENVEHGETGFVVGRRDARAIAERLTELAGDRLLRKRMGAAARQRATERFDIGRQLDELESLYRMAIALPSPDGERRETSVRREAAPPLIQTLERQLSALDIQRASLEKQLRGRRVARGVQAFVEASVPRGATIAMVSRGDEELVALDGRAGWHFPQVEGGVYAGHHPDDSDAAIDHLEELRARGATHLVIPATSAWWLEHYEAFRRHLETRYVALEADPETCVAYQLAPVSGPPLQRTARDSVTTRA